jgi:hypothetical protein
MRRSFLLLSLVALAVACGEPLPASGGSGTNLSQALAQSPDIVELEPLATRQALYRESTGASAGAWLFPVIQQGQLRAGTAVSSDLLQIPDAGTPAALAFPEGGLERWPEERRESLQGLSEREAAEVVARSLLAHWGIKANASIRVDRAVGAAYAVAYADGVLRVNPSFLYLAVAGTTSAPSSER